MSEQTKLLTEIRDLLQILAEPALAKRDERLREELGKVVGKSKLKAKSVHLMDGTQTQTQIGKASGLDKAHLSRFVKALRTVGLVKMHEGNPKLVIPIPPNFLDDTGGS